MYIDYEDNLTILVICSELSQKMDFDTEYFKLIGHYKKVTETLKQNIFINFTKLNLLNLNKLPTN